MGSVRHLVSAVYLLTGILVSAMGLSSFLLPNHFIDGGVTGVSMLLANLSGIPLSVLLVVLNIPFVGVGYRHIGRAFAVKSSLAIVGHALCLALIPFPVATDDKLLAAAFGGFFVGAGVGLAIRGGGVIDGTEILAVLISKRSFASIGEVVLGLNVVIFLTAALCLRYVVLRRVVVTPVSSHTEENARATRAEQRPGERPEPRAEQRSEQRSAVRDSGSSAPPAAGRSPASPEASRWPAQAVSLRSLRSRPVSSRQALSVWASWPDWRRGWSARHALA